MMTPLGTPLCLPFTRCATRSEDVSCSQLGWVQTGDPDGAPFVCVGDGHWETAPATGVVACPDQQTTAARCVREGLVCTLQIRPNTSSPDP